MQSRPHAKTTVLTASLVLLQLITACGGGGGGGSGATEGWEVESPSSSEASTGDDEASSLVHDETFNATGSGVTVGIIDSGANAQNPALASTDLTVLDYAGEGANFIRNETIAAEDITASDQDSIGHGTLVSEIIAGQAVGEFEGGVAPNAALVVAKTTLGDTDVSSVDDISAALSDLYDQGVRLFNMSLGSTDNAYSADSSFVTALQKVVSGGALVVIAAGNDGKSEPSSEASLGVTYTSLSSGMIAVAGANASATGLASGSNACGTAASYCLAAPYTSDTLVAAASTDVSAPDYETVSGTSFSTPEVTGTAALVWEKYPWMSTHNVQQTLLTTATYLGAASSTPYNSSTGWGLLNTDKAVDGPAMFYDSDFEADVSAGSYTFSNDISGNAGLQKSGTGTLVLSGDNTYTGDTTIRAGELEVSGSLEGSSYLTGGRLSGSGQVANVYNTAGTLSTEKGSLTILGDYSQGSSATYDANVGSTLNVTGSASLDGVLNVASDGSYITAGSYSLLTTGSGISGDFAEVEVDSVFLLATTEKNSHAYAVDINQVSASSNTSLTATSAGTVNAAALDTLFSSANTLSTQQAEGQPLSRAQETFLQTAGSIQAASSDSMALTAGASHSGVAYAQVPSALLQVQEVVQQAAVDRVHQALAVSQSRTGVWASGDYITGSTAPAGWNQADTDIGGLSLGYDFAVGDHLILGAFINQSSVETDWSDYGGKLKSKPTSLGIYGKYRFGPAYLVGLGHIQHAEADLSRYQVTTTEVTRVTASTDTQAASLYGEFGYALRFPEQATTITPFIGLNHDYVKMDGFDDDAGSSAGLTLSSMTVEQSSAQIGVRASVDILDHLQLAASLSRKEVFDRSADHLRAAFQIDPTSTYDIYGPSWGKSSNLLSLSLRGALSPSSSMFLSVSRKYGDGTSFQSFAAGYRYSF